MPVDNEQNGQQDSGSQEQQGQKPDSKGTEAKFTQADLDSILKDRLTRAKTSTEAELLKALGVDSPDTAKALIQAAREAEESKKTEQEKLQNAINTEKSRADTLARERDEALARVTGIIRDTALVEALKNAGAVNAADALTLLRASNEEQTFLKDDKPDEQAIKSAVEALKKDKKYLFSTDMTGYRGFSSVKSAGNPNPDSERDKQARLAMRKGLRG